MKPSHAIALGSFGVTAFALLLIFLVHGHGLPLLIPSGAIGIAERDLMVRTVYLMLIVVIPVVILAIFIAWHYREGNEKAAYTPKWEQSRMEELIWWSIPLEIVLVLAALTWSGTYELDPAKPLSSPTPPIVIQVVALPWKWLFIYPEQGVASVNELDIPAGRPVEFQITADAPMNSFWIPALGGQMYAMSGMVTNLHLEADAPGTYEGQSANYSGEGFAQMNFPVHVMDGDGFDEWAKTAASSSDSLTPDTYMMLAKPSSNEPIRYYGTMTLDFMDIVDMSMAPH